VEPSGWYFQFRNELCPDVADSAAAILALDRIDPKRVEGIAAAIGRGINWILSLQSSSGGWAAFDADIQKSALAKLPYADHDGMLDPACPDITGGVLEMLGRFPEVCRKPRVAEAIRKAVGFLTETQQHDGTWYGRWGVNYIHGTWQALKGLMAVGEDPDSPPVRRAVAWLKNHQNADGGWGEGCESYRNPAKKGQGTSTASQTSWALMGLVAAGEIESVEVRRGVEYLLRTQRPDGSWDEEQFTGTGVPQVLYLRHHLYRVYFPLLALGHYRNVKKGISPSSHGGEIVLPPIQRRRPSWAARLKRLSPFGRRR
jgi:squalene-hopene/tetraprenyl-beta-curcumene cyclase